MSELHSTEWDFSGLSAAEIEACIRYELAREIQARDTYFGGEIDTREIRSMSDLDILISNENPHLFPGITSPVRDHVISLAWPPYFPLTPWQQIPNAERLRVAEQFSNRLRAVLGWTSDTWHEIREHLFTVGHRGYQSVPLTINWKQSNGVILDDFRLWLEENRPAEIPIETERGRQSLRDDLRAISSMRLRHFYFPEEAMKLTEKVLGAPMYSTSFTWDRAASRGVTLFKSTFPNAGEPRSAQRKSSPRGRPLK